MEIQLVMFELNLAEPETVEVLRHLPSRQRDVATQLLAELMARSLQRNREEDVGEEGEANE